MAGDEGVAIRLDGGPVADASTDGDGAGSGLRGPELSDDGQPGADLDDDA